MSKNKKPVNSALFDPLPEDEQISSSDVPESAKIEVKSGLSDEAKKSTCNLEAYGLVYDRESKRYEIVTIKFNYDKQYASFEKTENVGDHFIVATNKLTGKLDMSKIRSKGKGEQE